MRTRPMLLEDRTAPATGWYEPRTPGGLIVSPTRVFRVKGSPLPANHTVPGSQVRFVLIEPDE